MTEKSENLVLEILRGMRADMDGMRAESAARDEKTQAQIGILAQGLNSVRTELQGMRSDINRLTDCMAIWRTSQKLARV